MLAKGVKENEFGSPLFLLTAEVTVSARAAYLNPIGGPVTRA